MIFCCFSTHRVLIGGLELQEPADVEEDREDDEGDDGHAGRTVRRAVVGVADGHVPLDGHGER
jgi:hypothetical protein